MNDYFEGAANQLLKRGKLLLGKIPRGLPREFHLLEYSCRGRIQQVLNELGNHSKTHLPAVRLRALRRAVRELDYLETIGIAALNRADLKEDVWLNELILCISKEIAYPLPPPAVTSLSQSYFRIYTDLHLLCVPLAEGSFLLHLPDMYHELAHSLAVYPNDPHIEPFQIELIKVLDLVLLYYTEEIEKLERKGVYEEFKFYNELWNECWWRYWGIEFFCDLFAVYAVGPAYGWSHYHLVAKRGSNLFDVPTTRFSRHPADAARMYAILCALEKIGFAHEAQVIKHRWDELETIAGCKPHPEYSRCYPDHIIQFMVERSLAATQAISCTVVGPDATGIMYRILNEAWSQFWKDPQTYAVWEQQMINSLRQQKANLNFSVVSHS